MTSSLPVQAYVFLFCMKANVTLTVENQRSLQQQSFLQSISIKYSSKSTLTSTTRSTITSFVSAKLNVLPPRGDPQHCRNGHILCHTAIPVHLAKACTTERDQRGIRGDPRGGGGEGRLTQPGKTALFTGPDTQSRNAFSQSKERNRKKGEEGREGEREEKRRNESRGNMCLTVRNRSGSNLHIYGWRPE